VVHARYRFLDRQSSSAQLAAPDLQGVQVRASERPSDEALWNELFKVILLLSTIKTFKNS
jgi:hypothetical protein